MRTLPNGSKEYYEVKDRGFYRGGFENPDSYRSKVSKISKEEAERKMNKVKENIKPNKLFISHSSKDVEYIKLFVELLEDIGMLDGSIVCTSVAGHGIPGGEKIYQWLRKQFVECDIRVVFALSHNYYASPASLNEMGAAWITRSTDTLLLLPGFDFSDIKGCIDSGKIGIKLDGEEEKLRYRLDEFKDILIQEYSLPQLTSSRWERHRNQFIDSIKKLVSEKELKKKSDKIQDKTKTVEIGNNAAVLLVYAAEDSSSEIIMSQTFGGTSISSGQWEFIGNNQNARNIAIWTGALKELEGLKLIEAVRKKEIFKVTALGYQIADNIKVQFNINTEQNPESYLD